MRFLQSRATSWKCQSALTALLSLAAVSSSCTESPSAPTVTTASPDPAALPQPPVPSNVITGTVLADGQPVPNAGLEFRVVDQLAPFHTEWAGGRADSGGRYQWDIRFGTSPIWITAYHPGGAAQPCAVSFERDGSDAGKRIDIALTRKPGPFNGAPEFASAGRRKMTGTVYEMTDGGKRPVQGAFVSWDILPDIQTAWTSTDSAGRFSLCELPEEMNLFIVAAKGRVNGTAAFSAGADDIEMEMILD